MRTFLSRACTQDELAIQEVYYQNTYRLPDKLSSSDVVLDLGAHIGSFAISCLERGCGRVLCYEPDPDNFKLLEKNLEEFRDRVQLYNLAVTGKGGKVKFFNSGQATACHHVSENGQLELDSVSLNSILDSNPFLKILKIDIEGAELEVLRNTDPSLFKEIEEVCLESHGDLSHKFCLDYFSSIYPRVRQEYSCEVNRLLFARRSRPTRDGGRGVNILITRFPYGGSGGTAAGEHPNVVDWLIKTTLQCEQDLRINDTVHWWISDTPITMCRNNALAIGLEPERAIDLVVMIDNDMKPDYDQYSPEFWSTAFNFWWNHDSPCVVASPYCGPPPHENVYAFEWKNRQNDSTDFECHLSQMTREQAAVKTGIGRVAAAPTGLFLISTDAYRDLPQPWFYYEYPTRTCTKKVGTEDVAFTRDLDLAGVPVYITWDCWSGHWKQKLVKKPEPIPLGKVPSQFRQVVAREAKYQSDLQELHRSV